MTEDRRLRALELYCGLGGFSAAVRDSMEIVGALDAGSHVLEVYRHNFDHPWRQFNLMSASAGKLGPFDADLWWMSPPCAPYTVRGLQRDLEDRRAESFLRALAAFGEVRPSYLALENVEGFHDSDARALLLSRLESWGYESFERILCPTELGVPNRRPRYYLVAALDGLREVPEPTRYDAPLADYLDESPDEELFVDPSDVEEYGHAFEIDDPSVETSYSTCFTSAYGKSWVYSGSYLRTDDGRIRRYSPEEIARLLHFPAGFSFPEELPLRKRWKYIGNSLSIAAVREVLRPLCETNWSPSGN